MATLSSGQSLQPGQSLQSDNELYTLIMQSDGNVVLYDSESWPLWATNTGGGLIDPLEFIMQSDGNLVLYDTSSQAKWASNTSGNPGAFLDVQDDGNLVVYRAGSTTETADNALWAAGSNFVQAILAAHNGYRSQVGVPPLQWSGSLAANAQDWANYLAAVGTLQEPDTNFGVNLVEGSAGDFSVTQLVGIWGNEQQYFEDNPFPGISTTGNWEDAGHYSQMVWRNTTEVGGGLATGQGLDFLVCYYNPPGNVEGETPY
jgi:hypothetical protein